MTEDALKKIGRNVLKTLGIGLDDRKEKITSLSHNKRRAVKTLQVRTREVYVFKIKIFNSSISTNHIR